MLFSNRRVVKGASVEPFAEGESIIKAQNLELKNLIGCPYSNVNVNVEQGQVFAICGRNGSGKTALLLTLAGRMIFTKGSLEILGYKMPLRAGKVHRRIGLAFFEGLNDLSENQQVRSAVAAEFELWGRKAKREAVDTYLQEWGLSDIAEMRVGDLEREQFVELGIKLAWVGHPDIIAVDDIESGLTKSQSEHIMENLLEMARERNVTILVGVLERDLAAMANAVLYLEENSNHVVQVEKDNPANGSNDENSSQDDTVQENLAKDEAEQEEAAKDVAVEGTAAEDVAVGGAAAEDAAAEGAAAKDAAAEDAAKNDALSNNDSSLEAETNKDEEVA